MITKRMLKKELEKAYQENDFLRRANRSLCDEINYYRDKIDHAVNYCEERKQATKPVPAWLREVARDA